MSAALRTAPADGYSRIYPDQGDDRTPTNQLILHGLQPSGLYYFVIDLDTYSPGHHTPGQDADAARRALAYWRPEVERALDWHRSKYDGWHGCGLANRPIAGGKLYDQDGRHIGEVIADEGAVSIPPAGLAPGHLSATQLELLFNFWHVDAPIEGGERWSARAKEGQRYTAGWRRHQVTQKQLRTFLQEQAGPVGRQLDRLFDERPDDRSDAAGHLAQCLMLHIHKIAPTASFAERCALVMAYWVASDSYGKASEKDYNQEKDGYSLIAQIVNGDPYGPPDNPRRWTIPFWAKSHPTPPPAAPEPVPAAAPARPAHRPKGDAQKHLQTFRRVLAAIEPDDFGRRVYTLEYLAERMAAAKSPAAPRTIQAYLKMLRERGEISTAQIGGNGRPYALLTSCFGGAKKSPKAPDPAAETAQIGGANKCAIEPTLAPEVTDRSPQCKEDHQNPSAPPPARVGLVEAVRQAFDLVSVDRATGERRRITRRRLLAEIAQLGCWPAAAIDRAIVAERQRRQRRSTDRYLADVAERASNLRADQLKSAARSSAGAAHAARTREDPRAWLKVAIAGVYAAEETRRQPGAPELTTHELWAQVDEAQLAEARRALRSQRRAVAAAPAGAQLAFGAPLPAAAAAPRADRSLLSTLYARKGLHSDAQRVLVGAE